MNYQTLYIPSYIPNILGVKNLKRNRYFPLRSHPLYSGRDRNRLFMSTSHVRNFLLYSASSQHVIRRVVSTFEKPDWNYLRTHFVYNEYGGTDIPYGEILMSRFALLRYLFSSSTFYNPPTERDRSEEIIKEPEIPTHGEQLFTVQTYTCSLCKKEKHMNAFGRDEHFRVASYCLTCSQDISEQRRQRWLYMVLGATGEQADIIMSKNVTSTYHALYISLYMLHEACHRTLSYSDYKTVFELRNIYLPQVIKKIERYGYSDHLFIDEYRFWVILDILIKTKNVFINYEHSSIIQARSHFYHPDLGVHLEVSFRPIRGIVAIP